MLRQRHHTMTNSNETLKFTDADGDGVDDADAVDL